MGKSIIAFAEKYRLRVRRDECGDPIVVGKLGELYQHDDGLVGLVLMSPNGDDPKLDNTLRSKMRKALREGLELHQRGDYESSFLFDAENKQHARLAIRLIGCKRKRRQTGKGRPFTSERVKELARIRFNHAGEGPGTAQKPAIPPGTTRERGQEETTPVYAA